MSRWINKLIARHLEPEHNVKPLLAGVFHAVSGQAGPFVEEEVSLKDAGKSMGNKEKVLPEGRKPAGERPDLREADIVKDEKKELKEEKPLLEDKEAYRVKERESVLPAEGEVTREKEREPVMDNMRMKKVPVAVQDDIQTQMRTRVKYVTREIPVLQDLIEEEQVVGKGPADEKSMVSSVRAGKVAPPAPGIVKHHNTLNVLNNNIIPAPERQTIHVSIGRIEIKAVAPPVETKAAPVKKDLPIIGLDQYLEQRNPAKR